MEQKKKKYLFCFYLTIHVLGFGYFLFLLVGCLFCAGAGKVLWAEAQESADTQGMLWVTPAEAQAELSAVEWGCTGCFHPGTDMVIVPRLCWCRSCLSGPLLRGASPARLRETSVGVRLGRSRGNSSAGLPNDRVFFFCSSLFF